MSLLDPFLGFGSFKSFVFETIFTDTFIHFLGEGKVFWAKSVRKQALSRWPRKRKSPSPYRFLREKGQFFVKFFMLDSIPKVVVVTYTPQKDPAILDWDSRRYFEGYSPNLLPQTSWRMSVPFLYVRVCRLGSSAPLNSPSKEGHRPYVPVFLWFVCHSDSLIRESSFSQELWSV